MRIGERKTRTYYWTYKLFLKQTGRFSRAGKTRYSPNFETIQQAEKFRERLQSKNKWYAGQLWHTDNMISDRLVWA